jgi:hypothetical protein
LIQRTHTKYSCGIQKHFAWPITEMQLEDKKYYCEKRRRRRGRIKKGRKY